MIETKLLLFRRNDLNMYNEYIFIVIRVEREIRSIYRNKYGS